MERDAKLELQDELEIDILFKMVANHFLNYQYYCRTKPLNGAGGINFNDKFLKFPKGYARTFKIIKVEKRKDKRK